MLINPVHLKGKFPTLEEGIVHAIITLGTYENLAGFRPKSLVRTVNVICQDLASLDENLAKQIISHADAMLKASETLTTSASSEQLYLIRSDGQALLN